LKSRSLTQQAERGLLGLFILSLVWLPLPLGSNRQWPMALYVSVVWMLLALTGLLRLFGSERALDRTAPVRTGSGWGAHLGLSLLVLFTAWCAFQLSPWGYTEAPHDTRLMVLRSLGYVGMFWLVLLLVTSDRRRTALLSGMMIAGVVQAMIAIVLYSSDGRYTLMDEAFVQGLRATGTFAGPDALANYLLFTLSAGVAVMLSQMGQQRAQGKHRHQRLQGALEFMMSAKMIVRLMLIIMVIALVLTRSRLGNGAFFVALMLVTLWIVGRSPQLRRPAAILAASLLVIDLIVIGQWIGLSKVIERMHATELALQAEQEEAASAVAAGVSGAAQKPPATPQYREETLHERTRPLRDAMAMIEARPWTGFGAGAFYSAFTRYKVESTKLFYDHAHSDYVEIVTDTGLIGLSLLGALVLLSAGRTVQLMGDRHGAHVRGVAAGCGMGIVCALLHATLDLNLQINANAAMLTVLLAVVWSVPGRHVPEPSQRPR
jgi:O-antigen ligase